MAGKRMELMNLRDLIKLKKKGLSNRKVAGLLGISRNTANNYVRFIKAHKLSYSELLRLDNTALLDLFPGESEVDSYRFKTLSEYFPYFERELKKPGCTRLILWKEYKEKHPDGYMHSQFNYYLNRWRSKTASSCKLEHKAAEKLLIDFTGKKLEVIDKQTGEIMKVNVFVGILPASGYTFVKAVRTQSVADVVDALNTCFDYIGGVPLAIVPDNMKAAVVRSSRYAAKINPTLRDLAHHYGCAIDPARPYSPKDKAMVEGAVKLVYQRIFYPLSKHTFFCMDELNKEIRTLLDRYNKLRFSQSDSNREQEFEALEKQLLTPLPETPYLLRYFKKLTVQKMGYICLSEDKHYYSVPYRFIGKQVTVCYSHSSVEVYFQKQRIALHKRDLRKGKYSTKTAHLSSANRAYSQWNLEFFQTRASKIGPCTQQYITKLILKGTYPEVGYKQANGIIHLTRQYAKDRLEKACERALKYQVYHYYTIEKILKKGLDKDQEKNDFQTHIPNHHNIRGAKNYQ